MNEGKTTLKVRMWLEIKGEGALFGPGTMHMLLLIDELGSLNKAAAELNMSYRRAWGRLREAEERIGRGLVEHVRGRKGYSLTPFGRQCLEAWRRWQQEVETFARKRAGELFPAELRPMI